MFVLTLFGCWDLIDVLESVNERRYTVLGSASFVIRHPQLSMTLTGLLAISLEFRQVE